MSMQELADNIAELEKLDVELIGLRKQHKTLHDQITEKSKRHEELRKIIAAEVEAIDCSSVGAYGWDQRIPALLVRLRNIWKPKPPKRKKGNDADNSAAEKQE